MWRILFRVTTNHFMHTTCARLRFFDNIIIVHADNFSSAVSSRGKDRVRLPEFIFIFFDSVFHTPAQRPKYIARGTTDEAQVTFRTIKCNRFQSFDMKFISQMHRKTRETTRPNEPVTTLNWIIIIVQVCVCAWNEQKNINSVLSMKMENRVWRPTFNNVDAKVKIKFKTLGNLLPKNSSQR